MDYDKIIEQVDVIMKPFGKRPDSCDFSNGGGYLQHNANDVNDAKKLITELGNKIFKTDCGFGFIGRYFQDSGYDCLYRAWHRLQAIDNNSREWGQTYYAINPDKGKQIELNK